jgi:hypothetical protein
VNSLCKLIAVYAITIATFCNYSICQIAPDMNYSADIILKYKIKSISKMYNDTIMQTNYFDTSGLFFYETGIKGICGCEYEVFNKYNTEKQLIEKKTVSSTLIPNKKYTETEKYKYDNFGNLIRDGMKFNDRGQLIETNDFYGELGHKKFVYEYNGDLIVRIQQVDDSLWYTIFKYNDNGILKYKKENSYTGAPDAEYYRTREINYFYDYNNRLICEQIKYFEIVTYYQDLENIPEQSPISYFERHYEYDKNLLTKVTSIFEDNEKEFQNYFYDSDLLIREEQISNTKTTIYNYYYEYY